ncbi:DUF4917 family protein [bacterium]|nr:DUF4917 family protein [bacterium]
MSSDYPSLGEILDLIRRSHAEKNVLLGNGFSISLFPSFHYPSLADVLMRQQSRLQERFHVNIPELISRSGLTDFERLSQLLQSTSKIVTIYPSASDTSLKEDLESDAELLRHALASAIQHVHPDRRGLVAENTYASCRETLSMFDTVFTTNYNLLLEWTLLARLHNHRVSDDKYDGFKFYQRARRHMQHYDDDALPFSRYGTINDQYLQTTNRKRPQNVFYLHGALHLYIQSGELTKLKGQRDDNDFMLVPYIRCMTDSGLLPLIVAESDPKSKMRIIREQKYLRDAYDALRTRSGTLVIFGSKLYQDGHDTHIADAIVESQVSKVYFGYQVSHKKERDRRLIEAQILSWTDERDEIRRHGKLLPKLEVIFYDTSPQSFWRANTL